jgi:hypothetical protein
VNDAADVGRNATFIVQDAPTARVVAQLGAPAGKLPVVTRKNGCGVPPPNVNVPPARAAFPVLVTVSGNGAEVVSVNQLPKFSEVGDTVAVRVTVEAVPLSETGDPVTVTLAAMVSVPENEPVVVGANTTLIVHVDAAFNVPLHVPPAVPAGREKGAVAVIAMPVRVAVPTLRRTSCFAVLVVPVPMVPNDSGPPVTFAIAVAAPGTNSTAPASTNPFVFRGVPK